MSSPAMMPGAGMVVQNAQEAVTKPEPFLCLHLRIGVTGHRKLQDPERIRQGVEQVLAQIDAYVGAMPHRYHVISPLADGADRLVAHCILEWTARETPDAALESRLNAVLPMPPEDYVKTFDVDGQEKSIKDFRALLARSATQLVLPPRASRHKAYLLTGQYVVDHSDVMIAIWDGDAEHGKGGTAEVYRYAKTNDQPIYWIDAISGNIKEFNVDRLKNHIRFFRIYENEAARNGCNLEKDVAQRWAALQASARSAGLDASLLEPLQTAALPHWSKASNLASYYHGAHLWWVSLAYALSACAVGTAAYGALTNGSYWWFLAEFIVIAAAVFAARPKFRQKLLRKWLDYRYLAERMRAACFLYVAGLNEQTADPAPDMQLAWSPQNWMTNIIRTVWEGLPSLGNVCGNGEPNSDRAVWRFVSAAWIDAQRDYYAKAARTNEWRHKLLESGLKGIVVATLVAALAHAGLHNKIEGTWMSVALSILAVTLPAVASALAGIDVFGHFERNAERYGSMSRSLAKIGEKIKGLPDGAGLCDAMSPLQRLVSDADELMSHEQQGWRFVFGERLPGPG